MRAERMVATLLLMQSRGRVTARELAAELEVSVATARRDLEALAGAGIPVYPQPGRGGGWSLVGGARTNLSGLTSEESRALFLLLGPAASTSPQVSSAIRKLLRALPGTFQADAQAAAAAVRVDDAGWGELKPGRPTGVETVERAIVDRTKVTLDYTNRTGRSSRVTVSPLRLVDKDETWYLLALRDRDGGDPGARGTGRRGGRGGAHGRGTRGSAPGERSLRTYRMDRVGAVEPSGESAEVPADLDLDAEWQRVVDHSERHRSLVTATVTVDPRHVWILRDNFGRHLHELGPADDGAHVVVRVAAHTPRSVAEQLAGWGAAIEVLEPDSVRTELARIGAELTARYGEPG
ncbi:WYL domain-containing protein [Georgenia halophila]|uniref:WYL domain-containing protein n=1 Tax=Georgenia halophila TaxID=620889 RepID=A0ABP8LLZ5_9MICO